MSDLSAMVSRSPGGVTCLPLPFSRTNCAVALVALLALGLATKSAAQVFPDGTEFQVNTYTTSFQGYPAVDSGPLGNFVVAWQSYGSAGNDTSFTSIQARRFDSHGRPIGPEFQVNTFTENVQAYPSIAVDDLGRFFIVWVSDNQAYLRARRFESDGTPLGAEFQVNTNLAASHWHSAATVDSLGNTIVVWQSSASNGSDSNSWSIQARRYDPTGNPLEDLFQVNTYTTGAQWYPAVAALDQGEFVVVWSSEGSSGSDDSGYSIQAQRFDADAAPLGSEFQVNAYTTYDQHVPSVASDGQGGFVVAWENYFALHGQRFDADGAPVGDEFRVDDFLSSHGEGVALSGDPLGNVVATWYGHLSPGTDQSQLSVQARSFEPDGSPLGPQFQVNTYTTNRQFEPAIATDARGNFVVVWQSYGSYGTDSSYHSVQLQRFGRPFFYDGFESGDTSRWSAAVP